MRAEWRPPALTLGLICLALAIPAAAEARLPPGFAGVVPHGPLSSADFERMGELGLGLRLGIRWCDVEPKPGHYDFSALDA